MVQNTGLKCSVLLGRSRKRMERKMRRKMTDMHVEASLAVLLSFVD
jgi:dihydropteroate synthase